MTSTFTTPAKNIRYISMVLFVISLACPCFDTGQKDGEIAQGGQLFLMGITWFIYPVPGMVGLANPAMLISWITVGKKPDRSFVASMVAVLLSLSFLLYKNYLLNESGAETPITIHRIGYWLWLTSILVMVLGNLYLQFYPCRKKTRSLPKWLALIKRSHKVSYTLFLATNYTILYRLPVDPHQGHL